MTDWIDGIFAEKQRKEQSAREAAQKRDRVEKAFAEKIDSFWTTFLQDIRAHAEEFNAKASPTEQVTIATPEPEMIAFRNDGNFGGQFVARLRRDERRGDVDVLIARSIINIDCPIVVREDSRSLDLAFKATNGQLHDSKRAARMLLERYFRWIFGLIDTTMQEGKQRIGFGA